MLRNSKEAGVHEISEVLLLFAEEEALLQFQLHSCVLQERQNVIDVIEMGLLVLGEDEDVFEVDQAHPPTTPKE